jgi:hypothetical protein
MTKEQLLDSLTFSRFSVHLNGEYLDYGSLARALFPDVEWFFDEQEENYEGDWYMAGKNKEGTYYFFTMSYGSCSRCDWLEEAISHAPCDEPRNTAKIKASLAEIIDKILQTKTLPDKASMLTYATKFDWQGMYDEKYRNAFVGNLLSAIEAT